MVERDRISQLMEIAESLRQRFSSIGTELPDYEYPETIALCP
ncbi:MAG: hypothetical protein JWQ49_1980 [Edaphobacter sp.]|nr:hypothetical protein [Edaphobacter sp.]